MPVWHDATRKLREAGQIEIVGLIQEQHPDRCKLFMQWKQMDWPVLVDPLNVLEVSVVPMALLIDERGVVREVLRDPRRAAEKLTAELDALPPTSTRPATAPNEASAILTRVSDALLLTRKPRFDDAIRVLDEALRKTGDEGAFHFARGVGYRMRYDSPQRREGDFAAAVTEWQRALDLDPNQYIWRRRIQQYGPRLDKPYPFYDWVEQARSDIVSRGDTPAVLRVEPAGAELAGPAKDVSRQKTATTGGSSEASAASIEPDPNGRIARDVTPLVSAEITVVPPRIRPGRPARVHIVLRPNRRAGGHWNNEGDPLVVWIHPPAGWTISDRRLTVPNPQQAISGEPRRVEFEVRAPQDAAAATIHLSGYALYGVCETVGGKCLHRRTDLSASIEVATGRDGY